MESSEKPSEPSMIRKILERVENIRRVINEKVDSMLDTHPEICKHIGPIITRVKSKLPTIR